MKKLLFAILLLMSTICFAQTKQSLPDANANITRVFEDDFVVCTRWVQVQGGACLCEECKCYHVVYRMCGGVVCGILSATEIDCLPGYTCNYPVNNQLCGDSFANISIEQKIANAINQAIEEGHYGNEVVDPPKK